MIDTSELTELLNKFQDTKLLKRVTQNSLYNMIEKQQSYTAKNTHFKNSTGATLSAMDGKVNGLSGSIFVEESKIPYIVPLYDGWKRTEPIEPVNKKALSWASGGSRFFASRITKPASYKGNPFILNAYNKNINKLLKMYQADMTEQLEDAL